MADAVETWDAIVAKISRHGRGSLSAAERIFFLVNRLAIDLDMGGFSGCLYNLSPPADAPGAWRELREVADAVGATGAADVAAALRETATLLESRPSRAGSWESFLAPIAPKLHGLETRVRAGGGALWDCLDSLAAEVAP